MKTDSAVAGLMLAMVVLTTLVDIWLTSSGLGSVSDQLREWSARWPVLPLAVGILLGHLWA